MGITEVKDDVVVVGRRRRRLHERRQGWVEVGLAVSSVLGMEVMVASSSSVGSCVVPLVQGGGLSRDEDGAGTECFIHSFTPIQEIKKTHHVSDLGSWV